jgi:hypothetical protein
VIVAVLTLGGPTCAGSCAANLEEGLLKLCTCLANSREEHMIMQPDESDDDMDDEGDTSGSEGDSDSGSEHDSGDAKGAAANGSEPEGADEANGHDAEGAGSHGGDDRHTHKDSKKVSGGPAQQHVAAVFVFWSDTQQ